MFWTRHFSSDGVWPLLLALLAGGCGDTKVALLEATGGTGGTGQPPPEQRVVLGSGWRAFEPKGDGDHVTLVAGPQGAHHVWTSFRSYGFDSDVLRMSLSMGWEDEPSVRQRMEGNVAARLEPDEDGASSRVTLGWPAVVPDPLCQDGRSLHMALRVSHGTLEASDERRWVLDVPEEYRPSDCEQGSRSDAGAADAAPADAAPAE